MSERQLKQLQTQIIDCQKCSRLVSYLEKIKQEHPGWWCRPVPLLLGANTQILIVGLAPSKTGANQYGRMFTGDQSAHFLYRVLYKAGLANQAQSLHEDDGLQLTGASMTAVARCAPPQNKLTAHEIKNCLPYLKQEIDCLSQLKCFVALGRIAHDGILEVLQFSKKMYPFAHGKAHQLNQNQWILFDAYHPSPQNVNTGRLTEKMLLQVFENARYYAASGRLK